MIRKGADNYWYLTFKEKLESFLYLRKALVIQNLFELTKKNFRFMMDTDESKYELGVKLMQEQNLEKEKEFGTICLLIKRFNDT